MSDIVERLRAKRLVASHGIDCIDELRQPTAINQEAADEIERLRSAMQEACELLAERIHGSPARSSGHNARLTLEMALHGAPAFAVVAPETPVAFGLEAQGHIPAVEAALAEGADWQEIGRRIGWDGETAKAYYERHLARSTNVATGAPAGRAALEERDDG